MFDQTYWNAISVLLRYYTLVVIWHHYYVVRILALFEF